jgi:superfamily II DNA or RNA helicase
MWVCSRGKVLSLSMTMCKSILVLAERCSLWSSIVATYRSIWRDKALSLYKPEEYKMVIVDEAHHAPADT